MIKMDPADQATIRVILSGLGLPFDEPNDHGRPRFRIFPCPECKKRNIFFNIPKNQRFVFQLIFENGNKDRMLRDQIANDLRALFHKPYPVGGGLGTGGYLTIYLPEKTEIVISGNQQTITQIIKREIDNVCKVHNRLVAGGMVEIKKEVYRTLGK
jgi:hypothetical protein